MYLLVFLGGALFGQMLASLPAAIFLRVQEGMSGEDILKTHPELKWMVLTQPAITFIIGLPLFLFFWAMFWGSFKTHGAAIVFFLPLFMVQSVSLANAFYEIHFEQRHFPTTDVRRTWFIPTRAIAVWRV